MKTQQPTGPTQVKWYGNGYQAALADIATALDQGGEDAVKEWLANNLRTEQP